jgi:opacity protein-like surface antigen
MAIAFVLIGTHASGADAQSRAMGSFGGFFTPFLGLATGGDVSEPRMTFGASVSVQEQDGWGAELDFGHAADTESGVQVVDLSTYMVNAAWIKPDGRIRPFGVAGAGVMQLSGCDAACSRTATTHDFGWTAGGGVMALLNDAIGVRGDVRYFFSSADRDELNLPDNFSFWRVSVGATLMWTILP